MPKAKDGKPFGNKMRMHRYEQAHKEPGPRAEANEIEARHPANEEQLEEQVHPGIHDEIAGLAEQHGPAMETHTMHDEMTGKHHLHTVHPDGHQHHSEHASAKEAHDGAMHASGVSAEEQEEDKKGEYPAGHKSATRDGEEDEYEPEPLD